MKIYNFDDKGVFTDSSEAILDELETQIQEEKKYLLPKNATFIAPNIEYDPSIENIIFDGTGWIKQDKTLSGEFYLKSSGEKFIEIKIKEFDKYTAVEPTLEIHTSNEGTDKIKFNEQNSLWEYSEINSKIILDRTRKETLLYIKQEAFQRIHSLFPDYKQRNLTAGICLIHNKEILAQKTGSTYELTSEEKLTVTKASQCNDFIIKIREKSNLLETLINNCTTANEILAIDISADNYWN